MSKGDKKDDNIVDMAEIERKDKPAEPCPELEAQMEPLHNNVFVRLDAREEMYGNIIIPDMAQQKRQEGTVVAAGPGRVAETGELIPCAVRKGDRVLLPKWGGSEEKVHGVSYSVVKDTDVLCRIVDVEEEEK
jgi:chaperonin GroES